MRNGDYKGGPGRVGQGEVRKGEARREGGRGRKGGIRKGRKASYRGFESVYQTRLIKGEWEQRIVGRRKRGVGAEGIPNGNRSG